MLCVVFSVRLLTPSLLLYSARHWLTLVSPTRTACQTSLGNEVVLGEFPTAEKCPESPGGPSAGGGAPESLACPPPSSATTFFFEGG